MGSEIMGMSRFRFNFGILGFAFSLCIFFAPVAMFRRIVRTRSTEQFSGVTFVLTLLKCLLSLWYGLPFVSPNNVLFSAINGTGAVLESAYLVIFLIYASKNEKCKILKLLALVLTFFAGFALVSMFALHGDNRRVFSGIAAAVFSIVMYGSPLAVIMLVIRTKNLEIMPFHVSMFAFLSGIGWLNFGLLGSDTFIAIPSGFCCGLGATQLLLHVIYEDRKVPPAGEANGSLEMAKADVNPQHSPKSQDELV